MRRANRRLLGGSAALIVILTAGLMLAVLRVQHDATQKLDELQLAACRERRAIQQEHNDLVHAVQDAVEVTAAAHARAALSGESSRQARIDLDAARRLREEISQVSAVRLSTCQRIGGLNP